MFNTLTIFVIFLIIHCTFGSELLGHLCNPKVYKKIIKPRADAHEKLLIEHYKDPIAQQAALSKLALELKLAVEAEINKTLADQMHDFRSFMKTKGCNGFVELYLTCDPSTSLCACKSQFPFNTNADGILCIPEPGSICAIGDDRPVPCRDKLPCKGEGEMVTRYCGGTSEFEKLRKVGLARLGTSRTNISYHVILIMCIFAIFR